LKVKLNIEEAKASNFDRVEMNEVHFLFSMNEDEMDSFKLAEGIRKFSSDIFSLEGFFTENWNSSAITNYLR